MRKVKVRCSLQYDQVVAAIHQHARQKMKRRGASERIGGRVRGLYPPGLWPG